MPVKECFYDDHVVNLRDLMILALIKEGTAYSDSTVKYICSFLMLLEIFVSADEVNTLIGKTSWSRWRARPLPLAKPYVSGLLSLKLRVSRQHKAERPSQLFLLPILE